MMQTKNKLLLFVLLPCLFSCFQMNPKAALENQRDEWVSSPSFCFELADNEKLIIGSIYRGCYSGFEETISFSKSTSGYAVEIHSTRGEDLSGNNVPLNIKKTLDPSFLIHLDKFHDDIEKLSQRKLNCTSSFFTIYVKKGNSVLRLPEIACDWDGYRALIKAIDPPWPKEAI
jgi:hypothetical protein